MLELALVRVVVCRRAGANFPSQVVFLVLICTRGRDGCLDFRDFPMSDVKRVRAATSHLELVCAS